MPSLVLQSALFSVRFSFTCYFRSLLRSRHRSFSSGYTFGLATLNWAQEWDPKNLWPNSEMKARGELRSLWIGCLVALPSGAAVAASLLSGNQASLIGVAISASLLPPCVNCVRLLLHYLKLFYHFLSWPSRVYFGPSQL